MDINYIRTFFVFIEKIILANRKTLSIFTMGRAFEFRKEKRNVGETWQRLHV